MMATQGKLIHDPFLDFNCRKVCISLTMINLWIFFFDSYETTITSSKFLWSLQTLIRYESYQIYPVSGFYYLWDNTYLKGLLCKIFENLKVMANKIHSNLIKQLNLRQRGFQLIWNFNSSFCHLFYNSYPKDLKLSPITKLTIHMLWYIFTL